MVFYGEQSLMKKSFCGVSDYEQSPMKRAPVGASDYEQKEQ